MKKNFLIFLPLLFVLGIDLGSKKYILKLQSLLGTDLLQIHYNQGVMLGSFADLPIFLRIISISTIFSFIFFLFILINYLLKAFFPILRLGMSFFIGGIAGNALDRAINGKVLDFISFPFSPHIFFNLADTFQWIGFGLILWGLFKYEREIWHPQNLRGNFFVDKSYQLQMSFKFSLISLFCSLILGIFSYTFLKFMSSELAPLMAEKMLTTFTLSFFFLGLLFALILFVVGIFISHRSAGPVYAFGLFVEDLLMGKNRDFKLRQGDHHLHLQEVAIKLKEKIKGNL
ncbi:MAG: signal peptidase II [Bacteriovoracaceae bacterium]|nr:signal peptidase II [Bacteriovoracaceae bacterium]